MSFTHSIGHVLAPYQQSPVEREMSMVGVELGALRVGDVPPTGRCF